MSHHLQYWTQDRAVRAFSSNERILHLENGWYKSLKQDDVLWILTSTTPAHDLALAIRAKVRSVEELNSHPDYAVGNSKIFRNFRASFDLPEATSPCRIPVALRMLRQFRFKTGKGIKSLGNLSISEILAGPLASRRRLTDGSAEMLEQLWESRIRYPWA